MANYVPFAQDMLGSKGIQIEDKDTLRWDIDHVRLVSRECQTRLQL